MNPQTLRPLLKALYPVGALILIGSVVDPLVQTWPFRLSDIRWRFGAVGLASTSAIGVTFALVWLMGVAALLGHRRTLRALSAASAALGIVVLVVLGLFVLDFLQVRTLVDPQIRRGLDLTVLKSAALLGCSVPVAFGIGVGGWLSTRATPLPRAGRVTREAGIILRPQTQGGNA